MRFGLNVQQTVQRGTSRKRGIQISDRSSYFLRAPSFLVGKGKPKEHHDVGGFPSFQTSYTCIPTVVGACSHFQTVKQALSRKQSFGLLVYMFCLKEPQNKVVSLWLPFKATPQIVSSNRHNIYIYIYMGVVLKLLVRSLVFGDHRCWLRYLRERFAMELRKYFLFSPNQ